MSNVLIAEFKHETNSFCSQATGKTQFKERYLKHDEELLDFFKDTKVELGGMMDASENTDLEVIPSIAANAMPGGQVTREMFEYVKGQIIEKAGENKVDGLLLSLHGAMVLEDSQDGEGELLLAIKKQLDSKLPIIATLDLHANVTRKMTENADALFAYDTYPHVDQYQRGYEAAELMDRTLKGETNPVMRLEQIPILAPPMETAKEPMNDLVDLAHQWEEDPKVISVSVIHGFPWADINEAGCSVLAVTDNYPELAGQISEEIGREMRARREEFIKKLVPVQEAIERAKDAAEQPTVLANVADNPGGGGPGDGTHLLQELLKMDTGDVGFAIIVDPEVVQSAVNAGVRSNVTLNLGGKVEPLHGEPLNISGRVKTITDGCFKNKGPVAEGLNNDIGKTAVIEIDGVQVIVPERRMQPLDPEIFRRMGIEPLDKQIIVVKSSLHYKAAYG
ncbi:MAG: M81 family metallopeptidase, partial [Candidatus Bipolaricaulota bacterium]